jgi:hypothetical protein
LLQRHILHFLKNTFLPSFSHIVFCKNSENSSQEKALFLQHQNSESEKHRFANNISVIFLDKFCHFCQQKNWEILVFLEWIWLKFSFLGGNLPNCSYPKKFKKKILNSISCRLESKANKSTKSTNQCGAYCIIVVPLYGYFK